jgi:hypothetical protein
MENFVAQHFAKHPGPVRPALRTKRGWSLSVQASAGHYSSPRADAAPEEYTMVEVFGWGRSTPAWLRKHTRGSQDPATFVPVSVVNAWVKRGGGLA